MLGCPNIAKLKPKHFKLVHREPTFSSQDAHLLLPPVINPTFPGVFKNGDTNDTEGTC